MHSFSIIACDKNTLYIASWVSSRQAFFTSAEGGLLGGLFVVFFCQQWLPERVASSRNGEFAFNFLLKEHP